MSLLYTSTCFERNCAHRQEVKIVSHSIWHHTLQAAVRCTVNKTSKKKKKIKNVAGNGLVRRFRHTLCLKNMLVIASTSSMGENEDSKSLKSFFQHESQGFRSSEWGDHNHLPVTVIPRLTKIIRSGITFVSRNVVIRRLTSRCLERKQPSLVGGSPLCDVVSSFLCHTHTDGKDKLLEWPDRSCLLLYVSARIH